MQSEQAAIDATIEVVTEMYDKVHGERDELLDVIKKAKTYLNAGMAHEAWAVLTAAQEKLA